MQHKDILVSIIVPIYNVDKYLEQCISSILDQSYTTLEIILIDDGSTDTSAIIIDKFARKDSRVQVIYQKNCGVSSARNTGLQAAGGKYVMFIDPDDWVTNDYVEYLLDLAEENNADMALTIEKYSNYCKKQVKKEVIKIFTAEKCAVYLLCYNMPVAVWSKIYRRSFLDKNGIRFFEDIYIGEDFIFNMLAIQHANKIVLGNRKIYYYRKDNSASATTNFTIEKAENGMKAIELIKNNLIIRTDSIICAWEFANWRTATDMYDQLVLSSVKKEHSASIKKYRKLCREGIRYAFTNPVSKYQRIRAVIIAILPNVVPLLMHLRRICYHVNVGERE